VLSAKVGESNWVLYDNVTPEMLTLENVCTKYLQRCKCFFIAFTYVETKIVIDQVGIPESATVSNFPSFISYVNSSFGNKLMDCQNISFQ